MSTSVQRHGWDRSGHRARRARISFGSFAMHAPRGAWVAARCPCDRTRDCLSCATVFPGSMVPPRRASHAPSSHRARFHGRSSARHRGARRRTVRRTDARVGRRRAAIHVRRVPSDRRARGRRGRRRCRVRRDGGSSRRGSGLFRRRRRIRSSPRDRDRAHRSRVRRASGARRTLRGNRASGGIAPRGCPRRRAARGLQRGSTRERLRPKWGRPRGPSARFEPRLSSSFAPPLATIRRRWRPAGVLRTGNSGP